MKVSQRDQSQSLEQTLHAVKERRIRRRQGRIAGAVCCALAVSLSLWSLNEKGEEPKTLTQNPEKPVEEPSLILSDEEFIQLTKDEGVAIVIFADGRPFLLPDL